MEKFFKLLYYYGLGIFVFFVVYLVTVMFMSPRQDALKRGFIPCTEQLVNDISECKRGSMSCPLKHLLTDIKCNTVVVLDGFGAWVKGEQSNPWETYLFTPVTEAEIDDLNPYEGNSYDDMQELEEQRAFIEQKQQELDAAKNRSLNLKEDVLLSDPDKDKESEYIFKEDKLIEGELGNIDDETYIGDMEPQRTPENELKKEKENNEKK